MKETISTSSKQHLFCLRWPWEMHQNPKSPSNCNFDTPWLFKSLQNLGSFTSNLFNSVSESSLPISKALKPLQLDFRINQTKDNMKTILSSEEQGEAEQQALASALASGKEATVVEFYSPKCRLCNSLLNLVLELEKRNSEYVNIVMADAENEKWLPEVLWLLPYCIDFFVLLKLIILICIWTYASRDCNLILFYNQSKHLGDQLVALTLHDFSPLFAW